MVQRKSKEVRREEIAEAAIKIIGERGLREFTAAQLAEVVGIKDGTIFRHFKDKHEIMVAVLDRIEQTMVEAAPAMLTQEAPGDPLDQLREFVLARIQVLVSQPGMFAIIFSDQLAHAMGPQGQERVIGFRQQGRKKIRACLQEAQALGRLSAELDLDSAVLLVNGLVMSLLFEHRDGRLDGPIGEIAARSLENLIGLMQR